MSMDKIFGAGGVLENSFDKYEEREGQTRMAQLCHDIFRGEKKSYGVIEGACGIGKSFGYLVPAMMAHGRVFVVTSTIALQEQIAYKDAPMVKDMLTAGGYIDGSYKVTHLKGRSNYLCRVKMEQAQVELPEMWDDEISDQMEHVLEWFTAPNCSGDKSDLTFIPHFTVKNRCFADSDSCLGDKCSFKEECYYKNAKEVANGADLVVLNYHMLFAHFSVKEQTKGKRGVIDDADIIICDEGHEIADVARGFWGDKVTRTGLLQISGALKNIGKTKVDDDGEDQRTKEEKRGRGRKKKKKYYYLFERESKGLGEAVNKFFDEVDAYANSDEYDKILREPEFVNERAVVKALEYAETVFKNHKCRNTYERTLRDMFKQRVVNSKEILQDIVYQKQENRVYYLDRWKKKHSLASMPIDVSIHVGDNLFDPRFKVVVTSATLSVGHDFSYVKEEIGLKDCEELVEESPFDMERQCLFVMPEIENEPNDDGFVPEISDILSDIVNIMGGRTLVLFTSYKQLNSVYDIVSHRWPYLLKQGDATPKALAEEFRNKHNTALLATTSFWTGVDIQGGSLSCLAMAKLPFASLDDPVNVWLSDREGYGAFVEYSLPRAVLRFKQGFGRLIRHAEDVGVFVLLDPRLKTKSYRGKFLASLPKMLSGSNYKLIPKFFGAHGIDLNKGEPEVIPKLEPQQEEDELGLDDDDPFKEDF